MTDCADVILGILAVLIFIAFLFIYVTLGTLIGAFTGWVLSLFWAGEYVVNGFAVFGLDVSGKLIEVGAMFGFISGFLKGIIEVKHTTKGGN